MRLERLIADLSSPAAYPVPSDRVELRQTHISVVFLVGELVYKIKKPVNLGFLDFTTLERRRQDCDDEVRLNRRLAPGVYLGVVPITQERPGESARVQGSGPVVEWAVQMVRLPDEATLLARMRRGELTRKALDQLAERLARFHRVAERSDQIRALGRFTIVAGNARENFEQSRWQVGSLVDQAVWDRLYAANESAMAALRAIIESRADRGVPCDTHGDLHLDHVYWFPDRTPPEDWLLIDCLQFLPRFRFGDPISDIAFLVMDLAYHGRRDLARAFADSYLRLRAADDRDDGAELLPFYAAYRAAVRAKVDGLKSRESEVDPEARGRAERSAQAHWLLALATLEPPARKPALVLIGGLPGSGKSTLARSVAARCEFEVIRTDEERRSLIEREPAVFTAGRYTPKAIERVYQACREQAERKLRQGGRVIVDATFLKEHRRQEFLDLAVSLGVPTVMLITKVSAAEARRRIEQRAGSGDASEATVDVHGQADQEWQPLGVSSAWRTAVLHADEEPDQVLDQAIKVLEGEAMA